ncbi:hypothetical protein [Pseudohongiella sp.]|uniref:Uncharacterized protein n=1 Tax=marine sediment metagenome TaxID=412755 RepID=A0A0F9Z5X6_9ZZZZ|nr:hypothetical protein [Pseudohongiella sp.]HDZ08195.1 hypothetical protein [Pseudohongiella sp.]HEA63163.1 hypothetical protein [Pseudohongiella sp.]
MNNSLAYKFLAAAVIGLLLLVLLGLVFIGLTDRTRETVSTAPPQEEVRQPRAPEPATSTAPGAQRNTAPPPIFATDVADPETGNRP